MPDAGTHGQHGAYIAVLEAVRENRERQGSFAKFMLCATVALLLLLIFLPDRGRADWTMLFGVTAGWMMSAAWEQAFSDQFFLKIMRWATADGDRIGWERVGDSWQASLTNVPRRGSFAEIDEEDE